MAAPQEVSGDTVLSKAEYLKRYLGEDDSRNGSEKKKKNKRIKPTGKGMKIVDDDIDWKQLVNTEEKENQEEDEDEAPVVAEIIDERPEEVKRLEEFRTSNRWRLLGATNSEDSQEAYQDSFSAQSIDKDTQRKPGKLRHDSPDSAPRKHFRHDSPDLSPARNTFHDSPVRKIRHDSPDLSPVRERHHSPPGVSPKRKKSDPRKEHLESRSYSPAQKKRSSSPSDFVKRHNTGSSPSRRSRHVGQRHDSDSDLSPKRCTSSRSPGSDLSPPRKRSHQKKTGSDSDLSPPRRSQRTGQNSDSDLSPPRRVSHHSTDTKKMLSGGAAGLVSAEVLRREKEENRKRDKKNQPLEDESHNAKTVFRDKSGKRRDLEQEREEQQRRAGEQAERDSKYAQWGKGLAQAQMQEQNVKDAIREAQKPLARHIDDEDLDKMLREQEREGDPMAGMLRKRKEKQGKGAKEIPRYKGPPPPPNRFNIMPGYRWDGVDRSNGFEKQRYSRMADQRAVQEMAYKWSVEDM